MANTEKSAMAGTVAAALVAGLSLFSAAFAEATAPDAAAAQPDAASSKPESGGAVETVYRNEVFGFSMKLPGSWHMVAAARREELSQQGREAMAGDDAKFKEKLAVASAGSETLLMVFQYDPEERPGVDNPSITAWSEKLPASAGIENGAQYLLSMRRLMQRGAIPIKFADQMLTMKVNGKKFFLQVAQYILENGGPIQEQYAIIMNGYALGFAISYRTADEGRALRAMINTIEFDE